MKRAFLLSSFFGLMMATTALACPPCEPDEEPPTVEEPETPAPVEAPVVHDNSSDRDALPKSTYYPCCIRKDGTIEPKWDLFRTPQQVMNACERAIDEGKAVIYACDGDYVIPLK